MSGEKVFNELLNNGRKALASGEWEKARELLEKALILEKSPEVYEELGWACWWLNDAASVFEYRAMAYKLFIDNNNNRGASRNAGWICLDYIEFKGEFAVASGWLQRADNLLKEEPDCWEISFIKLLKARWAFEAEKNTELAFKLIDESSDLSKSLNNIDGEMLAEALKGFIMVVEGRISEGMPLLDEATLLALTNDQSDVRYSTITYCYLIDACERVRDYERASQWCNNVKELCKRWRYKAMFANCTMKYAGILISKGEWNEAEVELLKATKELEEYRPLQVSACVVRLADLKRRQGKWTEAAELLRKVDTHPLKLLYEAELCFDKGDFKTALYNAERYLRRFTISEKVQRTAVIELLIRIYLKLGDLIQAESFLYELKDIADAVNNFPLKAAYLYAHGTYNLSTGNFEIARQQLEDSIDIYDRIGLPYESSRCRLILSESLKQLDMINQADAEINEAMVNFKMLGAEKDFEKAKLLLKNLYKSTESNNIRGAISFTGREQEVLRLLAEGLNNEDIAEKLFLSVRTVEKHITNIYNKLGVTGKSARAYTASYAVKHKII